MNQPEWLDVLRQELEVSGRSQNQLAAELGVSPSLLSQVLRGTYPGSTEMLQISVEGILMHREVMCPIKGSIPVNECAGHQNKPFSSSNRERVKLYRACRSGCPHSRLEATAKSQRIDIRASSEDEVYNLENQLAYLKRAANGDIAKLNELLEKELIRLGSRYNQLLWKRTYSRRKS